MRREVIDCDRCPAKEIAPIAAYLVTGRSPDPAGGCSEDDVETVHLCPECAAAVVAVLLKPLSYEVAAKLHKDIKDMKRRLKEAQR